MNTLSLSQLIITSFKYYDIMYNKHKNNINSQNIKFKQHPDTRIISTDKLIIFDNKDEYDYEVLGYYDNNTNIWIWGWVLPNMSAEKTIICKELLEYGITLEPSSNSEEHYIIKSLLVNSRLKLEEFIQLESYLSIIFYLIKNKILFIYPRILKLDEHTKKFITIYYIIKNI